MQPETELEQQVAQPIDEVTRAALEEARVEMRRGEGVTLEEARRKVKEQYRAWRKLQEEVLAA